MIIDTSAILAVLLAEPDAKHYATAITTASPRRMSAVASRPTPRVGAGGASGKGTTRQL